MKDTLQQLRDGELAGTRRFALAAGLEQFPREIFALAGSLEILDLSGNALQSLPDDLHRFTHLRVLFCSNNAFTELPACIGDCAALEMVGFKANRIAQVPAASLPPLLRWLILTDNRIEELPDELGRRPKLQKLMLAGNQLRALPKTLAGCEQLELLRIAANRFDALPDWIASLPRLAWLAFGGNPMSAATEASALTAQQFPTIDESRIALQEKLGEGASGIIYRALWQRDDGEVEPLAVKRFKGAITSDGTPRSEMAACMAAGAHPRLIGATARVASSASDTGSEALAMRLIDPAFKILAGPPSLESCTRDIYDGAVRFTPQQAFRIASCIAGAVAQLHARGILHGDLYAHNILRDGGDALLGDFGAASFFEGTDGVDNAFASALERIESRAFGCLLEELVMRCDASASTAHDDRLLTALIGLQQRCLSEIPGARPTFAQIATTLAALG
ncbi:leucine-rich repeat-containing protein kinase family protein [Variovorax sp. RHLX14]|uniref:leucine-rich repeat-containing protein kinase family protein n=1 Tax=Variovorax sp. RHLX14 TaxID=1259731 RepID=UPI003F47DFA1